MATAEECREALQALTARLGEMPEKDRSSFFSNRTFSCHVTDLERDVRDQAHRHGR